MEKILGLQQEEVALSPSVVDVMSCKSVDLSGVVWRSICVMESEWEDAEGHVQRMKVIVDGYLVYISKGLVVLQACE